VAEGFIEGIWIVDGAVESLELQAAGGTSDKGPGVLEEAVQKVWSSGQPLCVGERRLGEHSPLLHFVGVLDQMTSRPLVVVSSALPVPKLLAQPKSCW
jgi:hypothetical protein